MCSCFEYSDPKCLLGNTFLERIGFGLVKEISLAVLRQRGSASLGTSSINFHLFVF